MNKNQIAVLVLIVALAGGASYLIGSTLLGKRALQPVSVKTATPIKADVVEPDETVFTDGAINPTVKINIGGSNNSNPIGN
jgi:hypothetical protein